LAEKTAEKVSAGDFIRLEYTGRSGGKVFDTTDRELAKQAGVFDENAKYGPILVAAGREQVLKGLDEALVGAEVSAERRVSLPPEKAFGHRNPELVRLISLGEFRKRGIDPAPGMVLDLDGTRAFVQSVSGGRVRVDLNHELADKAVEYSFKVVERITAAKEKLAALSKELLPGIPAPALDAAGKAALSVPASTAKDSDYVVAKIRFVQQALMLVPEVKMVTVTEDYEKPAQAKEAAK